MQTQAANHIEPKAELGRLQAFTGKWRIEGTSQGASIHGQESFRWLEGNFFLVYEWYRIVGESVHRGTGLLGYDPAEKKYFARLFDNLGSAKNYGLKIRENRLTLTGDTERAVLSLNEAENILVTHWEICVDGNWESLSDLQGRKIGLPALSRVS